MSKNMDQSQTSDLKNKGVEQVVKNECESGANKEAVVVKKKQMKDWDKIVKDFEEEEEEMDNGNVDDLFKKLYNNADEDTRRAMQKSFVESKGTTLSMDWKKVGKKFVKPYGESPSEDELSDEDIDNQSRTHGFRKYELQKDD